MVEKGLNDYFENFLKKKSIFRNKRALQGNYFPKIIPHREKFIQQVASILAPSLRLEKPSNIFLYGRTGSGKTLCVKYTTDSILEIAKKNGVNIKVFYLNCKLKRVADTEYRLIAQLTREFGTEVPATGLPTDEVYKLFVNALDKEKILLVIVLDEIDQLVTKTGDEILYNLTRLNSELKKSEISLIGISNDLIFTETLDPRVKSSLSEEEILFPPYNALQLQKILKQRSRTAFNEGVVGEGVVEKCAAYAAREHGDARRALELLRVAGELTERDNKEIIDISYIDQAEDKIERDRISDTIENQPKQFKIVLYSILDGLVKQKEKSHLFTGDIYDTYKDLCFKVAVRPLTQRRFSDIVAELDMLGIIHAKVISKGRYGRTRAIGMSLPNSSIPNIISSVKESLNIA